MVAPITLNDAKAHLKVEDDAEDGLIASLIAAAARHAERAASVVSEARTETFYFDGFSQQLLLNKWPVDAASVEIAYIDTDGVERTISTSSLRVVTRDKITRVLAPVGTEWPATYAVPSSVAVTASVGFAPPTDETPSACPDNVKHAVRLLVGHFYRNREAASSAEIVDVPLTATDLLEAERIIL
jgi:uncharacterized phiE125 gp8 family phage protein